MFPAVAMHDRARAAEALRELAEGVRRATSGVRNFIAVMSGKGGVGKSTISASIAIALHRLGKEVAVLDADIHGPSIPWLMGVEGERMYATEEGRILPVNAGGVKVVSVELALDRKDLPIMWRGPVKSRAILDLLSMTQWGELDYVVVDLPPGTGDEALTIARYLRHGLSGAILVLTPGLMVGHVVGKCRNFAKALGIPLIGAVINMSYFKCPKCGATYRFFGGVAKPLVNVIAELPLDPRVADLADKGMLREVFTSLGSCEWVQGVVRIAREVVRRFG